MRVQRAQELLMKYNSGLEPEEKPASGKEAFEALTAEFKPK